MDAFKHILVAIDFGAPSDRALDSALGLAKQFGSKLTLLHAYGTSVSGYGYEAGFMWPIDELASAAQKGLDAMLAKTKERYANIEGLLVCGEPWREIIRTAVASGADLIVMGTHGRRGFSHALLGSVAEKVVRLSPIPVLTVLTREDRQARAKAFAETATPSEDEGVWPKPRPLIRL